MIMIFAVSTCFCVGSALVTGCNKIEGADAKLDNQTLLQQQIKDAEHDPSLTPEAKARYIQFLKDKLGGPQSTPAERQ